MFQRTTLLVLLFLASATLAMAAPLPFAAPEPAATDFACRLAGQPAPAVGVVPEPELKIIPGITPQPTECIPCRACTSATQCGGNSLGVCGTGPSYWTCGQPRGCICR